VGLCGFDDSVDFYADVGILNVKRFTVSSISFMVNQFFEVLIIENVPSLCEMQR
jgi:hypothetical protein